MIDTRSDISDQSFETKGGFLEPSVPEKDVLRLNQKEVRASVTEAFPNRYSLPKDNSNANLAQQSSFVIDLANRKTDSFSDRIYLAEVLLGEEIEEMRRAA